MLPTGFLKTALGQVETLGKRLVMSAQPVADFLLDYAVEQQVEHQLQQTLAEAHQMSGLDRARADYGFDGRGQTVVVIDTGIAWDHPALGGGLGDGYRVLGG